MSADSGRGVMAEASWLAALNSDLAPHGLSLDVGVARSWVCRDGIPTDVEVSHHRIHVRFTLRRRGTPSVDPIVLPGELGYECAFNSQRGVLEPLMPGRLLDAGSPPAVELLAHLESAAFEPDASAAPYMLVRDRATLRLCEETRTLSFARRSPRTTEAAEEIAALLNRIENVR